MTSGYASMHTRVIPIAPIAPASPKPRLAALGDLLRRHRRAVVALQWAVVAVYAGLVAIPALMPLPPDSARILDHLTRFAQFVFWGIWWPFVVLSIIVVGRVWCGFLCPEGALTEWVSRHGLGRRMPRPLLWGGWPFVGFITTTVYGQMLSVYEYPKPALLILGGSTLAAIVVGLLYGRGKRLWCRHLCPVSGVFAVLSRISPLHYRVDRNAWAQSGARAQPINCAPMVHIKSMTGGADCHMCARCSGHKNAIRLAARWPGREVAETAVDAISPWQSRLIAWGMMGVAAGAFQWSASPWVVAVKQRLAEWLVGRELLAPLQEVGYWWLFTYYPEANDVFTWLDGALLLAYIGTTAIAVGAWASLWLYAAERMLELPQARHALALTLAPFAGLTIFLGLLGLTTSQLAPEGIGLSWLPWLRGCVLLVAAVWSGLLIWAWIERQTAPRARKLAASAATAVALVLPLYAWVIFFYRG